MKRLLCILIVLMALPVILLIAACEFMAYVGCGEWYRR